MNWFLYLLRCADETLYAGITTDLSRRVVEHNESNKGARYTRARRPVVLVAAWSFDDRSAASKAEYAVKKLSRDVKLDLVTSPTLSAAGLGVANRVRLDEL